MIWILILIYFCAPTKAQPLSNVANITTKDGLASNVVKDIVQDEHGFMWFATQNGLARYDGYIIESIQLDEARVLSDVNSLMFTSDGGLWIGTKNKGLFFRQHGIVNNLPLSQSTATKNLTITGIVQWEDDVWIGTKGGLFKVDIETKKASLIEGFNDDSVVSITLGYKHNLWIATTESVYQYNLQAKEKVLIQSELLNKNRIIYKDPDENIWLGKDKGLFKFNKACNCFELFDEGLKNTKIHSLVADQNILWIGTLYDGLYRHDFAAKSIEHYQYNEKNNTKQLADTNIMSLFIDRNKTLWVGTFRGGVNYLNLSSMYFGLVNYDHELMYCAKSIVIYDLLEQDNVVWLASEKGLLKLNEDAGTCDLYELSQEYTDSIRSLLIDSSGRFWVGASKALYQFNLKTGEFKATNTLGIDSSIFFLIEYQPNRLLIGSLKGLYVYEINQDRLIKLKSVDNENLNIPFNNFTINQSGQYIFATNGGLYELTDHFKLRQFVKETEDYKGSLVTTVIADDQGGFWFGADLKYLLYLTNKGKVENRTSEIINQDIQVQDIFAYNKELWISSNKGLFRYDMLSHKVTPYDIHDGLQDNEFLFSSNYQSPSGKIYFGGKNGFNAFFPEQIPQKSQAPQSVISQIQLNGQRLKAGDKTQAGFSIDNDINAIDHLTLSHEDYKLDIEFSATDYADSKQNKYAYRLLGFNDEWESTNASNRRATYTNLNAGDYTFELKAANKYGLWSTEIKQLSLKILPAPWLSIWAYILYTAAGVLCVWGFIRYKARAAERRAEQLEAIIVTRTDEVNSEKKKVESLLHYKNKVFANITHEFKTPLSLITGPLDQLAQETDWPKHVELIQMVQRNSQRLMLMVSQILKLSEVELNKNALKESQAVQPTLVMLYEAFKPIADNKNITLTLDNNVSVNIFATAECLEIVIGNLLSNALKFTPAGGEISMVSQAKDNHIAVGIKDTGTGINQDDVAKIFTRFVRLDTHKNTQGTGIGLSVVKEITEANSGSVMVNSEWGVGSTFTVTFPVTDIEPHLVTSEHMVKQIVQNTQTELKSEEKPNNLPMLFGKSMLNILVIDDNIDMQSHIGNVLSQRFNCLFANRGQTGIALALEEVPDIIICDVMMPGMDGYKVTRVLRNDGRTSHIPIVLLTALNTKESRIKGWRENIDIYVTKPFDAAELNAQLDSVLIVRKILQQQTNKLIKNNGSLSDLNLPEQDLKFIQKLKDVISNNYTNSHFQKADLASKLAISERLLHRKVTALIDESPMHMLRNYRLEKAAISLKNGYQVSIISEECGFNSVPYFCRCFRENYGVSPKKYQLLHKQKN